MPRPLCFSLHCRVIVCRCSWTWFRVLASMTSRQFKAQVGVIPFFINNKLCIWRRFLQADVIFSRSQQFSKYEKMSRSHVNRAKRCHFVWVYPSEINFAKTTNPLVMTTFDLFHLLQSTVSKSKERSFFHLECGVHIMDSGILWLLSVSRPWLSVLRCSANFRWIWPQVWWI